MKKRILALVLSGVLAVTAVGCGGKEHRASDMSEYLELGTYTGFEIEMDVEVTDEELQKEIESIRKNYADYEQIFEGTVKDGDTVNIDFSGVLEGETEAFEGGTGSDYDLTIGSKKFPDNFEEQLIGHKPKETVTVTATFPEDYGNEDLNGKTAKFEVTINYICGKEIIPEWTDEFVTTLSEGSQKTTAEYEDYLREYFSASKKEAAEENKRTEVIKRILENAKVKKYDQKEIDQYYDECVEYYTSIATQYYGCTLGEFAENMMGQSEEEFLEGASDAAYQFVVGNLALLAIAYEEQLSITQKEYDERAEQMAKAYEYDDVKELEEECKEYGETYLWDQFLRDKALEFVLDTVKEI